MIKPAMEAKDYLQPFKKIIKKRDDKKVRGRSYIYLSTSNTTPISIISRIAFFFFFSFVVAQH